MGVQSLDLVESSSPSIQEFRSCKEESGLGYIVAVCGDGNCTVLSVMDGHVLNEFSYGQFLLIAY